LEKWYNLIKKRVNMAYIDRLKEEIGVYKVVFGILLAMISSLNVWIYNQKNISILPLVVDGLLILSFFVVVSKIKKLLNKIEEV
jgi:hypothetical protein